MGRGLDAGGERARLDAAVGDGCRRSVIAIFDQLCETVDDIPAPLIEHMRKLIEFVGPERYETALADALEGTGWKFTPIDAADFLTRVNLSLPFLKAA